MFGFKRKNRVIKLNVDKTYEEGMKPCKGGTINWDGDKKPKYSPDAVFRPAREGRIFRKPLLILFGENCENAYKFDENMKGLQPYWTKKEAERVQEKQLAMSLEKMKPITWNQVILLAIPIILNLVCTVILLNKLGIV